MTAAHFVGFLEGQIRQQPLNRLLDLLDRRDLGPEHVEVAPQPTVVLDLVNEVFGLEQGFEFVAAVRGDEAANDGAAAAARQNRG